MLADNRIALNAGWDAEMLSLELADLSGMGADLSTLSFTTLELSRALSRVEGGHMDEDAVPEIVEHAVSQPGDIWARFASMAEVFASVPSPSNI